MAYANETIGQCDLCCEACHLAEVGTKLDQLSADLDSGVGYSGDLLTATEVSYIEGCCEALRLSSFGTVLNAILTASKGYDAANTVSDTVKNYLDNCCAAFKNATVGTLIQNSVALINAMQEYDESFIDSLYFTGLSDYPATIDDEEETILVELPYGTAKTALVANFTTSTGASVLNGETVLTSGSGAIDYTSPVTLTCLSHDESTSLDYVTTVTVLENTEHQLLTFAIGAASGTIDEEAKTVAVTVANGTDVTALVSTFTVSAEAVTTVGAVTQVSGTTTNNFTSPVTYRVTSQDESAYSDYVVTVTIAQA